MATGSIEALSKCGIEHDCCSCSKGSDPKAAKDRWHGSQKELLQNLADTKSKESAVATEVEKSSSDTARAVLQKQPGCTGTASTSSISQPTLRQVSERHALATRLHDKESTSVSNVEGQGASANGKSSGCTDIDLSVDAVNTYMTIEPPKNSFALFAEQQYTMSQTTPGQNNEAEARWKALTDSERAIWRSKQSQDKDRYHKDIHDHVRQLDNLMKNWRLE